MDTQSPIGPSVLEDLEESFSFSEIKKRNLIAKLCTVLCCAVNAESTFPEIEGIFSLGFPRQLTRDAA